ncbi:hypothetical protein GH157_07495 [archaeon]|nr:hypothetical protein [archaeon]
MTNGSPQGSNYTEMTASPQLKFAQQAPLMQDVTHHSDHQDYHHRQDDLREHSRISQIPPGNR